MVKKRSKKPPHDLIANYCNQPPLNKLTKTNLSPDNIIQQYQVLSKKLLNDLQLDNDESSKQFVHLFAVKAIHKRISDLQGNQPLFTEEQIEKLVIRKESTETIMPEPEDLQEKLNHDVNLFYKESAGTTSIEELSNLVINILDQMQQGEKSDKSKKIANQNDIELSKILTIYLQKIETLFKESSVEKPFNASQLEKLISAFSLHPKILALRDQNYNPLSLLFSNKQKIKTLVNSIDKAHDKYQLQLREMIEHQSRIAYLTMLEDTLLQKPTTILPSALTPASNPTLVDDSEYPIPEGLPESNIEPNVTMNLSLSSKQLSALEGFTTKSMKDLFLKAFSWASKYGSIDELEFIDPDPNIDLLGTQHSIIHDAQLAVIKYVLVYLDVLGKISGVNGENVLQYLVIVQKITQELQKISEMINPKHLEEIDNNPQEFIETIHRLISDLKQETRIIYNRLPQNIIMNTFCFEKELLSHALTGIPFKQSILPDKEPKPKADQQKKRY